MAGFYFYVSPVRHKKYMALIKKNQAFEEILVNAGEAHDAHEQQLLNSARQFLTQPVSPYSRTLIQASARINGCPSRVQLAIEFVLNETEGVARRTVFQTDGEECHEYTVIR